MPPLPVVSGRQVIRAFERTGWSVARQVGSHLVLTKPGEPANLAVPDHTELDRGLLRKLVRLSGMTVEEFLTALERRG